MAHILSPKLSSGHIPCVLWPVSILKLEDLLSQTAEWFDYNLLLLVPAEVVLKS